METKNKSPKLERLRRSFKFPFFIYVDPVGLSGGLALWWSEGFDLHVAEKNRNLIHVWCRLPTHPSFWQCSFIYADPTFETRQGLWEKFISMSHLCSLPWIVAGDFNVIGALGDKEGGNMCNIRRVEEFQRLIFECHLMELGFSGPQFTWSNNRLGSANV